MPSDAKINSLLGDIEAAQHKLEELEVAYKLARGQVHNKISSSVAQLGPLCDSLAIRARVINDLYWHKAAPCHLITQAFGLANDYTVRKIAGNLILDLPCKKRCGNVVKTEFTSKSDLESRLGAEWRTEPREYAYPVCKTCEQQEKAELDASGAERRKQKRDRNKELRNMPWEEFVKTEEWIYFRSRLIHHTGYQCEVCHLGERGLYVYMHKGVGLDYHPATSEGEFVRLATPFEREYKSTVVCRGCIPRLEGVIDEKRFEFVPHSEFSNIHHWYCSPQA